MKGDGFTDGHFVMSVMEAPDARFAPARAEMTGATMRALQRDRTAKGKPEHRARPALIVVAVAPGDSSAAAKRISRALEGDAGPTREVDPGAAA